MTATVLFGLALAVGAPALKEKDAPTTLVGEWVIEQSTVGGKPSAPGPTPNHWVFHADGTRAIVGSNGKQLAGGTFAADARSGTLDLQSGEAPDVLYLCRFQLEGDTLKLAIGWQKAPRPEALESPPGSQCTLYVMKRVTKKN